MGPGGSCAATAGGAGRSRTSTYVRTPELGLAHNKQTTPFTGGRATAGGAVLSSYPSLVDERSITEAAGADRGREGSSDCLSKTRIHATTC